MFVPNAQDKYFSLHNFFSLVKMIEIHFLVGKNSEKIEFWTGIRTKNEIILAQVNFQNLSWTKLFHTNDEYNENKNHRIS